MVYLPFTHESCDTIPNIYLFVSAIFIYFWPCSSVVSSIVWIRGQLKRKYCFFLYQGFQQPGLTVLGKSKNHTSDTMMLWHRKGIKKSQLQKVWKSSNCGHLFPEQHIILPRSTTRIIRNDPGQHGQDEDHANALKSLVRPGEVTPMISKLVSCKLNSLAYITQPKLGKNYWACVANGGKLS